MSLLKLYPRFGGKRLLANEIVDLFPPNYENMVYVEPFFGGGSIYFKKNKSNENYQEVINDLDKDIYIIMKGFKKYDGDKISNYINNTPNTKEYFLKVKNDKPLSEYNKFLRTLYLIKNSYFGKMEAFGRKEKNKTNYENKYKDRLKNTIILNKDYKYVIKKYDSINTLFYLDPPYENSKNIYKDHFIDYVELYNLLKKIKGKFILSINYNKEFITLFKGFKHKIVTTKYTNFQGGTGPIKKELIFKNY